MSGPYRAALEAFLADPANAGWRDVPFFRSEAHAVVARVDQRVAAGAIVLPSPAHVFRALALTPRAEARVVILGQDPYPTPGDAHGLAFSYAGAGRLPASLKRICRELADDTGAPPRQSGDLSGWARQGVLLLNTALTVEAGRAGAHLGFGWHSLARDAVMAVSESAPRAAFLLWGDKARGFASLIDARHAVIQSAHPSPLAARGDFLGSRPFSRANAALMEAGRTPIDWRA